jgi:ABC-type cobalamin/Fe3+-siderophores transport system ATPase subunit
MIYSLDIPTTQGQSLTISVSTGQALFVLGANGTGKSSLMQRMASLAGNVRRISAGRQNWLTSSAIEVAPSQKDQFEAQARTWDNQHKSRFMEQNPQMRSSLTLYDLVDAENMDARAIAAATRRGETEEAKRLAAKMPPIAKINEMFALSNLPIKISVEGGAKLMASKNGSAPYGVHQLSDGERNALFIAADVLTAKPGSALIIDEPERHLHRSIISPLLSALFRYRDDCAFIVATHDLMLPVDNPEAGVLLVRACTYAGEIAQSWDLDLLEPDADVDEKLKLEIVGARRRIVFVEGDETSLDRTLYGVLFPNISVRSKGSSRDVEHFVRGVRASSTLHWVSAWGIIDNDGREPSAIGTLQNEGIFALPFFSVESIYYHPDIISALARRLASMTDADGEANAKRALEEAISVVRPHLERLAARAVEKSIRSSFFSYLPSLQTIQAKVPVVVNVDTKSIVDAEVSSLISASETGNWTRILTRCPIRETPALDTIAKNIGFRNRHQYEAAVLKMLRDDADLLAHIRSFFGALTAELCL